MKTVKVAEATNTQLDWLVAKCEGRGDWYMQWWRVGGDKRFVNCEIMSNYSGDWSQMGPIIEREKIDIEWYPNGREVVRATVCVGARVVKVYDKDPLAAAARCYVVSKLGEEVDVPEELP